MRSRGRGTLSLLIASDKTSYLFWIRTRIRGEKTLNFLLFQSGVRAGTAGAPCFQNGPSVPTLQRAVGSTSFVQHSVCFEHVRNVPLSFFKSLEKILLMNFKKMSRQRCLVGSSGRVKSAHHDSFLDDLVVYTDMIDHWCLNCIECCDST